MHPIWHLSLTDKRTLTGHIENAPEGAVLCFSVMAPVALASEGKILRAVGGYTELTANFATGITLGFQDKSFQFHNVGWLPQGAYLRKKDGTCVDVITKFPPRVAPAPNAGTPGADTSILRLAPQPESWQPEGGTLVVSSGFSVASSAFSDVLKSAAELADRTMLGPLLGGSVPLEVRIDPALAAEAYTLEMLPGKAVLAAATNAGAFYGAVTLINLQATYHGRIPTGKIIDAPRFEWRGQQLDCARHFYRPETLLRVLDLMALVKLNRFHWHFCDDEAFRLEVECYPEIWQKTAMRGERCLIPGVFGGGQGPTGGSYSLEFARGLVDRAKTLHIEVLPEIEIPAHAYGLNQVFPALTDPADTSCARSVQGYVGNTMNPATPFMWTLTEALIKEITAIFPFNHIHLGCDERPPEAWLNSPMAQAFMAENNLRTADDLQEWAIAKAAGFARTCGAQPCAWEEAVRGQHGGIQNSAILFSWTGQGPGLEAARQGYQVVMSPAQHVYFDHTHGPDFAESGACWAGAVALEDTVAWHPVPRDEPELEANILGVEGAFWSEFTNTDQALEPMLAPRILGLSEMAWGAHKNTLTPPPIRFIAACYQPVFDRMHWACHSS